MPATALDLKAISPGGSSSATPSWEAMGAEFAELAAMESPAEPDMSAPKVSPRLSPREAGGPAGGKSWSKVRRKGSYVPDNTEQEASPATPDFQTPTSAPPSRARLSARRRSQVMPLEPGMGSSSPLNKLPNMEDLEKWANAKPEDILE